jgi:hypothetical protein
MVEWKGKHYKMEAIYYGEKNTAYYIFYEHDQVKCFTMDLKNKTIAGLDLSGADFKGSFRSLRHHQLHTQLITTFVVVVCGAGTALVEYHPVYHWEKDLEMKSKKVHIKVFDTQEDREIKRVDYYLPDHDKGGSMYAQYYLSSLPRSSISCGLTLVHCLRACRTFHEVNYGPQADSLFKIPKLVMDQCNEKLEHVDLRDIDDPAALAMLLHQ